VYEKLISGMYLGELTRHILVGEFFFILFQTYCGKVEYLG